MQEHKIVIKICREGPPWAKIISFVSRLLPPKFQCQLVKILFSIFIAGYMIVTIILRIGWTQETNFGSLDLIEIYLNIL